MATWDDSVIYFYEYEEHSNMALMADVRFNSYSDNECVDEEIEVIFDLSHNQIIIMLNEFIKKNHNVPSKLKSLRKAHFILTHKYNSLQKTFLT